MKNTPFSRQPKSWLLLIVAAAVLSACSNRPVAPVPPSPILAKAPVRIVTSDEVITIIAEIAETPSQRRQGLMGRRYLEWDAGMLFIYEVARSGSFGFWMHNTNLPLDIAYLSEDGVIGAIHQMEPCVEQSNCPIYPAGVRFAAALEVNQGFFESNGVNVGDRVEW